MASEYVFLFRDEAAPGSSELRQRRMQKWVAWTMMGPLRPVMIGVLSLIVSWNAAGAARDPCR
jgi:hypothetical protein